MPSLKILQITPLPVNSGGQNYFSCEHLCNLIQQTLEIHYNTGYMKYLGSPFIDSR